ncbi:hypothetical protein TIFTF001_028663 [Ficus carica]|uniref:Uncharacterized protein n=1 Tax=Ficus carica TaxID=3494 RepID=A0AA88DQ43_FICCA|nr:hypothetical protein TIFTF001_028663 [Ficus carica]
MPLRLAGASDLSIHTDRRRGRTDRQARANAPPKLADVDHFTSATTVCSTDPTRLIFRSDVDQSPLEDRPSASPTPSLPF